MAKTYRTSGGTRLTNSVFRTMTRMGVGAKFRHILSVRGRKTGKLRSTPVDVMQDGDQRWLVAGYGMVNWVRNARAAGEVALSRGGHSETVTVHELSPPESAPVLRMYLTQVRVVRPYFDATVDSTDEELAAEASRHPVFALKPKP